jgi:hypothetical protein
MGSMNDPHDGQNCSSGATIEPQCSQVCEATSLLRGYCATGMLIVALRTYEPWSVPTILGALVLSALVLGGLIFALRRRNR